MGLRRRTHEILEYTKEGDRTAFLFTLLIALLIIFSVASVILESVSSIQERYSALFSVGEVVTVLVFTVEYALRIWSCTEDPRYSRPVRGRLRWALTFFALVDLAAFLPFYIPFLMTFDARFIRVLRLLRILRILKVGRYSSSIHLLARVLRRQAEALAVTLFGVIILIIIASSLMWNVEYEAQPQTFSSIPEAMWWAVATITTVGYGDVVPITPLGKILAGFIAILGVLSIALPAGIIVSGFMDERKEEMARCDESLKQVAFRLELLERLDRLKDKGTLTLEEFEREKQRILCSGNDSSEIRRE
ncbi:MAG: ion transporter [Methanomassiliicoccales archaeon]